MLPIDEITAIRATQTANLPDTAVIRRLTRASDGGGGASLTWVDLVTGVACRSAMSKEPVALLNAYRETVFADWIVTLPYGTDAVAEDEIVTSRGNTLVVVGDITGPWSTVMRLVCTERQ